MIPPCLTLSNIRYVSRVKWSNPGKGVAPSPTPRCSSYWKGSLLVALDHGRQLYLLYIYIYILFFQFEDCVLQVLSARIFFKNCSAINKHWTLFTGLYCFIFCPYCFVTCKFFILVMTSCLSLESSYLKDFSEYSVLKSLVVSMVLILPLISNSLILFSRPLSIFPRYQLLLVSASPSSSSTSFILILWSARTTTSTTWLFSLINTGSDLLDGIGWSVWIAENSTFIMIWRCPWCNDYRRRKWTRRHEFKSWSRLITFHIALIPLRKVWIQLFSLQLWVNSWTD